MPTNAPPISSPDGQRDYIIDMEPQLEATEVLANGSNITGPSALVQLTDVRPNTAAYEDVPAGRGLQFRLKTLTRMTGVIPLVARCVGDSGTDVTMEILQPVVPDI